jgi:NADP-dependent 3-hydroxy acid dehydrogenase YdfG
MGRLDGKVALITGAARGQGAATARRFVSEGAKVVVSDVLEAEGKQLAEELGDAAAFQRLDVTDEAQARGFIEAAHGEHGGLHVLVNNAGVMLLGPVDGAPTEEWRRMLEVNMWGLLICTHAALPLIAKSGGGDIVNLSSVAGRRADAGAAVYNMTKFGVHAFSEALRQEALHVGIRVTLVAPGFVETELQGHNVNPLVLRTLERVRDEIGEPLQAQDVADAIRYAVTRPPHVCLNEVLVRPKNQSR